MSQTGTYEDNVSPGSQPVLAVVGNDAVVVPPNPATGDINIIGTGGITASGNAGTYTLTIHPGGSGTFTWINATIYYTLAPNTGYVVDFAEEIIFTLPTTAAFGDYYRIVGVTAGSNGWLLNLNEGQTLIVGNETAVFPDQVASTIGNECVEILCVVANTTFEVIGMVGNIYVN